MVRTRNNIISIHYKQDNLVCKIPRSTTLSVAAICWFLNTHVNLGLLHNTREQHTLQTSNAINHKI